MMSFNALRRKCQLVRKSKCCSNQKIIDFKCATTGKQVWRMRPFMRCEKICFFDGLRQVSSQDESLKTIGLKMHDRSFVNFFG